MMYIVTNEDGTEVHDERGYLCMVFCITDKCPVKGMADDSCESCIIQQRMDEIEGGHDEPTA